MASVANFNLIRESLDGTQESLVYDSEPASPVSNSSPIRILNESNIVPDFENLDEEIAYYHMLSQRLSGQKYFSDKPYENFVINLDHSSCSSETTDDCQLLEQDLSEYSHDEDFAYITVPPETFRSHFQHKESMTFTEKDQYLALDDNLLPFSDDFAFNRASPETFRSFFEFKENSYPDEPAEKPKMLELSDIMDLIINSASPQCTEGVSLLDPLSSIVDRFRQEQADVDVSSTAGDVCSAPDESPISESVPNVHPADPVLLESAPEHPVITEPIEDAELLEVLSQDAHIAVEYATTPTTGLMFQFGGVSYEKVDNIDDFDKDEDEVFVINEPIVAESSDRKFATPPNVIKEDEEFYSFLSSRSRKIARNMSAGRRDKIRDQDYAYVQPKKLFLD